MHLCYITPINSNRTFLTGLLGLRSWVNYYTKSSTMPNCVVTVFALDEGGESEFKRIAATDAEFSRSTSSS